PPLFSLHLCVLPLSPPLSTLFPYTTLFRSVPKSDRLPIPEVHGPTVCCQALRLRVHKRLGCSQIRFPGGFPVSWQAWRIMQIGRSEEHTSELQSRVDLVCRLLLEQKKHM